MKKQAKELAPGERFKLADSEDPDGKYGLPAGTTWICDAPDGPEVVGREGRNEIRIPPGTRVETKV